jgi:hypothetical protein
VSHVRYELGLYIPKDDILHSHRSENLKSYNIFVLFTYIYTSESKSGVYISIRNYGTKWDKEEPHGVTSQKTPIFTPS